MHAFGSQTFLIHLIKYTAGIHTLTEKSNFKIFLSICTIQEMRKTTFMHVYCKEDLLDSVIGLSSDFSLGV